MIPANQSHFPDWSAPVNSDNLGSPVNSSAIDQHPAISRKVLSLLSNPTLEVGGLDIWVSQRASVDDPCGPPQNLRPIVHSSSTENAPRSRPMSIFSFSEATGGYGARRYGFLGAITEGTISTGDRQQISAPPSTQRTMKKVQPISTMRKQGSPCFTHEQ